nr:MAG TPA: hypothetical protein [Caudoviricetes sp.]
MIILKNKKAKIRSGFGRSFLISANAKTYK